MIALLVAAAILAPDPKLTPGKIDPAATVVVICQRGYTGRAGVRNVPQSEKRAVYAEYGVDPKVGGPYEVDHLISLELGGSNDLTNLWPQSYVSQPYNAHMKDALEDRLHANVCKGAVSLSDAQTMISTDWIGAYQKYFLKP